MVYLGTITLRSEPFATSRFRGRYRTRSPPKEHMNICVFWESPRLADSKTNRSFAFFSQVLMMLIGSRQPRDGRSVEPAIRKPLEEVAKATALVRVGHRRFRCRSPPQRSAKAARGSTGGGITCLASAGLKGRRSPRPLLPAGVGRWVDVRKELHLGLKGVRLLPRRLQRRLPNVSRQIDPGLRFQALEQLAGGRDEATAFGQEHHAQQTDDRDAFPQARMLPNSQSWAPGQCFNRLQILPQFIGAVMNGNVAPA